MWLAGGGVKGGFRYGATDDYGYYAVENKVHIHDLHATMLHLLGLDHERLTYRYAGRDFRLTDVAGRSGARHHRVMVLVPCAYGTSPVYIEARLRTTYGAPQSATFPPACRREAQAEWQPVNGCFFSLVGAKAAAGLPSAAMLLPWELRSPSRCGIPTKTWPVRPSTRRLLNLPSSSG